MVDRTRGGLQWADSHGNAVSNCELLGEQESCLPLGNGRSLGVKGRLKDSLSFGEMSSGHLSPSWILTRGIFYHLNQSVPVRTRYQRTRTKISRSVHWDLLVHGRICEVSAAPHICRPLSVVESSTGKKRLLVNLRHLKRFLWKQNFKYEYLRVALQLFEKGDFLFFVSPKDRISPRRYC